MNELFGNLKEENKKLRQYVDTKLGHANVQKLLTEKRAQAKIQDAKMATQNFISALRNPANRIVDCDMMDFLNNLRENFAATGGAEK